MSGADLNDLRDNIDDIREQNLTLRNEISDLEQKLIDVSLKFQLLKSALETANIEVHDLFMLNVRQSQVQLYDVGSHKLSQNLDEILGD